MTTRTTQRITLFLNPDLTKQARAQAVVEDETLSTLIEKALIAFLPVETVIKKVTLQSHGNSKEKTTA